MFFPSVRIRSLSSFISPPCQLVIERVRNQSMDRQAGVRLSPGGGDHEASTCYDGHGADDTHRWPPPHTTVDPPGVHSDLRSGRAQKLRVVAVLGDRCPLEETVSVDVSCLGHGDDAGCAASEGESLQCPRAPLFGIIGAYYDPVAPDPGRCTARLGGRCSTGWTFPALS